MAMGIAILVLFVAGVVFGFNLIREAVITYTLFRERRELERKAQAFDRVSVHEAVPSFEQLNGFYN